MADINKNINIKVNTNSAEVQNQFEGLRNSIKETEKEIESCLLYTSDAADE